MPFLSIIVPVFNAVEFLSLTIDSILNQSFSDFELILVNDGSTDGSDEKCNYIRSIDDRVVVVHQANSGVSSARNTGLKHASGKYIGFIDADDTIERDMYELLTRVVAINDADVAVCNIRLSSPNTKFDIKKDMSDNQFRTKILNKNETLKACLNGTLNWSANNKIFKATLARLIRFEGRMNEDLLYCFNFMITMTTVSVYIDLAKYNYIKRNSSVSLTSFSDKHMESTYVSNKILQVVQAKYGNLIIEAENLDFISNLSTLNLIILAGINTHIADYNKVSNTLRSYKDFLKKRQGISNKQLIAYRTFMLSSKIYSMFLKFYCKFFVTEVGKKIL